MWHLYVLELENGCYYVGITLDLERRVKEHIAGVVGANFTKANKPLRLVEDYCCNTPDRKEAYKLENSKTLEYAVKYGGDKVKGGKYFIPSKLIRKVKALQADSDSRTAEG